ncbi:MAG: periplasmic protein TonB [Chthoniobacter sp.]|jgi:protein TonB|nr:periplasmic protein TonB [Chthoniobacter sp.]
MSRSAIIASLALHAGFLFLVSRWTSSTAARIGHPGANASFFADDAAGLLVAIAVPSVPPEPPVVEPPLTEPEFVQPAPAVIVPPPPITTFAAAATQVPFVIAIPRELPAAKNASSPRGGRFAQRGPARPGGSLAGQRGSAAGGNGASFGNAGYVPPQFRLRYKPLYPEEARQQRLEGTVLLLVSIDSAGRVTNTNVLRSCGHTVLDRAALAAVRSWQFDPARQDGVAIAARVEVPVRFRFEERSAARS